MLECKLSVAACKPSDCGAVLQSSVPLTISRQLLSAFVQEIAALPGDLRKEVAT